MERQGCIGQLNLGEGTSQPARQRSPCSLVRRPGASDSASATDGCGQIALYLFTLAIEFRSLSELSFLPRGCDSTG
jgi:hypothetical protein